MTIMLNTIVMTIMLNTIVTGSLLCHCYNDIAAANSYNAIAATMSCHDIVAPRSYLCTPIQSEPVGNTYRIFHIIEVSTPPRYGVQAHVDTISQYSKRAPKRW